MSDRNFVPFYLIIIYWYWADEVSNIYSNIRVGQSELSIKAYFLTKINMQISIVQRLFFFVEKKFKLKLKQNQNQILIPN